jgi:hypothetical protein
LFFARKPVAVAIVLLLAVCRSLRLLMVLLLSLVCGRYLKGQLKYNILDLSCTFKSAN